RVYFFFQAEDGIRDRNVTGVQTCALPISRRRSARLHERSLRRSSPRDLRGGGAPRFSATRRSRTASRESRLVRTCAESTAAHCRSEERRVGKECRARWAPGE